MMPHSSGKYARADADYWQQTTQEYRREASQESQPRQIQIESEAEPHSPERGTEPQGSQTSLSAPDIPGEKTRRKGGASTGHIACDFCRQRKLRCTGEKPRCEACRNRDQECSYVPILRRRGPGKKKDKVGSRRRGRNAFTSDEHDDANAMPLNPPIRWRREGPRGGPSAEPPVYEDLLPTATYHVGYAADRIGRPEAISHQVSDAEGEARRRVGDDVP
ncbi:hypothetical protein HDZ31DRAFT_37126 [Schizophyllum fasciatum]